MKTELIGVRVTVEQKALLEQEANKRNISIQDLMRSESLKSLEADSEDDIAEVLSESPVRTYITLPKELDAKVRAIAEELGISMQACIRRLINEGNIYDLRIDINLEEEFLSLTSEINDLNRKINGIYSVCKRTDGLLTKHEIEHLYNVMYEIRDKTTGIISEVYDLSCKVTLMARKRMEKLIKKKTGGI